MSTTYNFDSQPSASRDGTPAAPLHPQSHYAQSMQDDEIDLFELGEKLWDRKWTIIAITAFISVL
ncbi:MAG: Wzz/FepE/Etk N-terminal domain-containing protein, partial [Kistimonas sp.]|nr:Wzz/FepE/Etk N-terminal domain-containing protein [Kistimonas sp.]